MDITDDLPKHLTKTYSTRSLSGIDTLVIHHSAGSTAVLQTIFSIANYHINNNDWPGIGYGFCVLGDGTVYQVNQLETLSYHAGGHNGHTVGICILGNFTDQPPTDEQIEAAAWLCDWLKGELNSPLAIVPHRQLSQTACPGATWENWFGLITG